MPLASDALDDQEEEADTSGAEHLELEDSSDESHVQQPALLGEKSHPDEVFHVIWEKTYHVCS